MRLKIKLAISTLIAVIPLASQAVASPPGGLTVNPFRDILSEGTKRQGQIENTRLQHGLTDDLEAAEVMFSGVSDDFGADDLRRTLIQKWSDLLETPVSSDLTEIGEIAERHGLSAPAAELVYLVRLSAGRPEIAADVRALAQEFDRRLLERLEPK